MKSVDTQDERSYLTPPEIVRLLRVSPEKVLGWIRRGELTAVNLGNSALRPRFRISPEHLDAFLKAREVQPLQKKLRQKRQEAEGGPLEHSLGEDLLKKKQAVKVGKTYYRIWNGVVLFY
jgi:excisionase family DNA binding protein